MRSNRLFLLAACSCSVLAGCKNNREQSLVASVASAQCDQSQEATVLLNHGIAFNEDSAKCITAEEKGDPYVIPATVPPKPAGFFKQLPADAGKCVSTGRDRPSLEMHGCELSFYDLQEDPSRIYVANVGGLDDLLKPQFFVASIPISSIKSMAFQIVVRKMPIIGEMGAHAQVRLKFDEDVILKPQFPINNSRVERTRDLILSTQGPGVGYEAESSLGASLDGSKVVSMGTYTVPNKVIMQSVLSPSLRVDQYPLQLSKEKMIQFVRSYYRIAKFKRSSETFYMSVLTKDNVNCNTTLFSILDAVMEDSYSASQRDEIVKGLALGFMKDPKAAVMNPSFASLGLRLRGLIQDEKASNAGSMLDEPEAKSTMARYAAMYGSKKE
jgi:hypothetical protein